MKKTFQNPNQVSQKSARGNSNTGKVKILLLCLVILMFGLKANPQTPLKPFPQHVTYTSGTIKPSNYTQSQLDQSVKMFYDQWKAVYLRDDCGGGQYYVWFDEESSNNSICVSEGQGYGMMITAYMAGYDPNAKIYFDGLYQFYKAHPSVNNNRLMAWNQVAGCIDDPDGGNDSATDGDLDIAFALLLADKQWGSAGTINYLEEAIAIINAIKQDDVNESIYIPTLGDWATPGSPEYDDTRPSDFIMDHFRAFQKATGDAIWNNIVNKCYTIVSGIQTNFSSTTGLLPDFIVNVNSSLHPAAPNYLEGEYDGDYYYNACRTPLRIATDYMVSGDTRGKDAVQKMNGWIKSKTGNDPANIHAGYYLNGNAVPDSDYESAAFSGPFAVAAMVDASNQNWLNDTYDFLLSLELQDYEYYDNTLKMLCLLVLSGNYWVPQAVQGIMPNSFPGNIHIDVYPNPFYSSITVSIPDRDFNSITISVDNIIGQTIYRQKKDHPDFPYSETIDLNFLSEGLYLLRIKMDGEQGGIKIMKR